MLVARRIVVLVIALLAGAFIAFGQSAQADHDPGSSVIDILALDVDSTNNTATHVETIDSCVSIPSVGGTATVDVVVDQVPATGMAGVEMDVLYNPAIVRVTAMQIDLMLAAAGPMNTANFSNPLPDSDGDYRLGVFDVGGPLESGEGVVVRLTFQAMANGVTALTPDELSTDNIPDILDADGATYEITNVIGATIAVGQSCVLTTDVAATAATLSVPASVNANTAFNVLVGGTIANNGPESPVNTDASVTVSLPPDCTAAGGNEITVQDTSLATGSPFTVPDQTFSVTCTQPSFHTFGASVRAILDDPGVNQTVFGNDVANASPATSAVNATADLELQSVAVTAEPTGTVDVMAGMTFPLKAAVTIRNDGPDGPVLVTGLAVPTVPADCGIWTLINRDFSISVPAGQSVVAQPTWTMSCTGTGLHAFSVDVSIAVGENHAIDSSSGNDALSSSVTPRVKAGVCGPDPDPAGEVIAHPSPALLVLISSLTSEGTPIPAEDQLQLDCSMLMQVHDQAMTPNDECAAGVTPTPCSLRMDLDIDLVGGSVVHEPSARLNPIGVSFLASPFDFAADTEIPNGTVNAAGEFSIRTDGSLFKNGIGCWLEPAFELTTGYEGGIEGNVPESNSDEALTDPTLWPNDLNAEVEAVASSFRTDLGEGVQLWSRTIVPMLTAGTELTMNILIFEITNPGFIAATGANWVFVPFPGDAVNPDAPGTIGGDPDADDPPETPEPLTYCTPNHVSVRFQGMAGSDVFLSCTAPGDPLGWILTDPDAVNVTGDEGPRSHASTCAADSDGDGLGSGSEMYWGTSPLDTDSDDDGIPDAPDNCKIIPNPGQENADGDLFGDICDPDSDGDGVDNGVDNCPNTFNPAQIDFDDDGIGDACEPCQTHTDIWPVIEPDLDCDGWTDADENALGTAYDDLCPSNGSVNDEDPDAWPPDFNDSQLVSGPDVLSFGPHFGQFLNDPMYSERHDLYQDDKITGRDILKMSFWFGKRCT
jgi:hypothetical protein